MKKNDFMTIHQWAEDCLKANAFFESRSAFMLISQIAKEAAMRGQKRHAQPTAATRSDIEEPK